MAGGYCSCACRDCMEIAISNKDEPTLCWECEEAGCDVEGNSGCESTICPDCGEDPCECKELTNE